MSPTDDVPVVLRQRAGYAIAWWILIPITGAWALCNGYLMYEIFANPAHNMEQGFDVIGWEAYLVVTLPIDCVFGALVFHPPQRRQVHPEEKSI